MLTLSRNTQTGNSNVAQTVLGGAKSSTSVVA